MLLATVLKTFNAPLGQEQVWAICYGAAKTLLTLRDENLVKRVQIQCTVDINDIRLNESGEIDFLDLRRDDRDTVQKERDLIFSLGNMLCRCLDYGLEPSEIDKVRFESDLAELIGKMVLQNDEDYDEGFDDDQLDESWTSRKFTSQMSEERLQNFSSLPEVMSFCEGRLLKRNIKAGGKHYLNVCKALFIESNELKTFLDQVLPSLDRTEKAGKRTVSIRNTEIVELSKQCIQEWSRLWLQVMHELRRGVHLRKVEKTSVTPKEFEYTPYEMLADEMVCQKAAKKRLPRPKKGSSLPDDAEKMILEFILSRPSGSLTTGNVGELCAIAEREELEFDNETEDFKTSLLTGIVKKQRSHQAVQPRETLEEQTSPRTVSLNHEIPQGRQRFELEEGAEGSKGELRDINHNILGSQEELEQIGTDFTPDTEDNRKMLKVGSPLWEKIENWDKLSDDGLLLDDRRDSYSSFNGTVLPPRKRSLITLSESYDDLGFNYIANVADLSLNYAQNGDENENENFDPKLDTISNKLSKQKKRLAVSAMCLTEIDINEQDKRTGTSMFEICKIRQEITRAETESINISDIYTMQVKYGKMCFNCRKVKFSLFNKCRVCGVCHKKFCRKCAIENAEIPQHLIDISTKSEESHHQSLAVSRPLSISMINLSADTNNEPITPFPCRNQSTFKLGSKKTTGVQLITMCLECKRFIDSIVTETRNTRWHIGMTMDI